MKKILLSLLVVFSVSYSHAAQDRFGNMRAEIPRSSFTASAEIGVVIASNPTGGGSPMVLRSITCSGVNATTITIIDANVYTLTTSTKVMFAYNPVNPSALLGTLASPMPGYGIFFSSAIKYTKDGANAPCNIGWDFINEPNIGVPYRP